MNRIPLAAPALKWAGGKRQLLKALIPLFPPPTFSVYCEPFVGGGALLFALQPAKAVINDINRELMGVYEAIRDQLEDLLLELAKFKNNADSFYAVRDWDRDREAYAKLPPVKKAARVIYLNKTCYNGLFRVNASGEFNTPFGHCRNPNIVNEPVLRAVNAYFNQADIVLSRGDYAATLADLPRNSFVYLDPPYDPVSGTANFTGYARGGFDQKEQIRLRERCDDLTRRGIKFLLSNSATDFIKGQYGKYRIQIVPAKRAINSVAAKRGEIDEIAVRNY